MHIIRRARIEDAMGIHNAHMRSIQEVCSKDHTNEEISGWGNRPFNEDQRVSAIENQYVWVVEIKNTIEGYSQILFKEREGVLFAHVLGLYLTPKAIGLRIGKQMLQLMIEEAKSKRVSQVTLESTITAHNFYQKFGFVDSAPQVVVQIGGSGVRCQPMKLVMSF